MKDLNNFEELLKIASKQKCVNIDHELFNNAVNYLGDHFQVCKEVEDSIERRFECLLDPKGSIATNRYIAACIWRMVSLPALNWLTKEDWRRKIVVFIYSTFQKEIKKHYKSFDKLMTHEKLEQLINLVAKTEENLKASLQSLTSFERISAHRHSLLEIINNKIGTILVGPFLPQNFSSRLGELYIQVENYKQNCESIAVIECHDELMQEIAIVKQNLSDEKTLYSQLVINEFIEPLNSLVNEDFKENKAVQHTNVIVEKRDKKYPFHVNEEMSIGLVVSNLVLCSQNNVTFNCFYVTLSHEFKPYRRE